MSKLSNAFWLGLVMAVGFTTYKVKYAVQDVDDQLQRARRQTIAEQQEMRVLTAEWTYLNQPERLADLNRRFLALVPVSAKQLQQRIDDIPFRTPPAAAAALVAANQAPPAPSPSPSAEPRVAAAALIPNADASAPPLRLARAGPISASLTLDALIAQIAARP